MPSVEAQLIEEMSPDALLAFLEGKLNEQAAAISTYDKYYDGEHKLAFATAKFREAFARYFPPIAINWMKVVVDTPASRLKIQGFRFNPDMTKPSWEMDADDDAWRIWQASNMDSGSNTIITDAIKYGISYAMVTPPGTPGADGKEGLPRITAEHSEECYVYRDPADTTVRLCGIKRWRNEIDNHVYAAVFLPDKVLKFKSEKALRANSSVTTGKLRWLPPGEEDNPIGVVPLHVIENKPDLKYGGRSDLEEAIAIQDAINKYCLDMIVSSEFHAYPQRYATGWTAPTDEQGNELSGREVEVKMGSTRLLTSEDADAAFGQLSPGDVDNYVKPIELFLDMLGSTTATPSYALKGQMVNLSADAMHAADTGLVDRCGRKINNAFNDNFGDLMRTSFLAMGDRERGQAEVAEVIWQDPERRSISQNIDAAVKMRNSLNVPIEMCWQTLGWSPAQIRMARDMMGLPVGGPGSAADDDTPDDLPPGTVQVNPATGKPVDVPILLGPNGQPLPSAQQPNGAGGTPSGSTTNLPQTQPAR